MFCPNCGTKTREGAAFCVVCGESLAVPSEPAQPQEHREQAKQAAAQEPSPAPAPSQADSTIPSAAAQAPSSDWRVFVPWAASALALVAAALMLFGGFAGPATSPELISYLFDACGLTNAQTALVLALGSIIVILRDVAYAALLFFLAAALLKRRGARACGVIAFCLTLAVCLLCVVRAFMMRWVFVGPDGSLASGAAALITLAVSVIGFVCLLIPALGKEMVEEGSDTSVVRLLLPIAILCVCRLIATGLGNTVIDLFVGQEPGIAYSILTSSTLGSAPPMVILALVSGLYLIIFGNRVSHSVSFWVTFGVSLLVGLGSMLFMLLDRAMPPEYYALCGSGVICGAISLLFQPVMLYQTAIWYGRSRIWLHIVVFAVIVPGACVLGLIAVAGLKLGIAGYALASTLAQIGLFALITLCTLPKKAERLSPDAAAQLPG